MAVSEFFSRDAPGPDSPVRVFGVTRLAVGGVYLLGGGIAAALFLPELQYVLSAIQYGTPSLAGTFDAVRAIVGVAIGFRGARMIGEGVGAVTGPAFPSTAPADLAPAEAEGALVRREPGAFRPEARRRLRFLRKWLPNHEPLLTARLRAVVDAGLGELGRLGRLVLLVAAGLGVVSAMPALRQSLFAGVQPAVPGLFLTLFGAAAVLHAWVAVRALPSAAPRADVLEFRGSARGGGDPSEVAHGLRQELGAIRASDAPPSRTRETGFALERGSARDAGTFEGTLLIETQPRFAAMAEAPGARMLLVAGAGVQLLALTWLLGAPERPETLITGVQAGIAASLLFIGQLCAGVLLARLGGRMVASGGELLRGFRFESLAALLVVRGSLASSPARVRNGMFDFVGTDDLATRTDVRVVGHVARLLTECRAPLGERMVVGMIADERAEEVELMVRRCLWRFERQAATIAPGNLRGVGTSTGCAPGGTGAIVRPGAG